MPETRIFRHSVLKCVMLSAGLVLSSSFAGAQKPVDQPAKTKAQPASSRAHRRAKKQAAPEPVVQTPPPPPMPNWPVNDQPKPASVVWDANGLRINASNSSLQQILSEISTETGSKVEGSVPDQRVYGNYGPGQARDVLSELLQGSGYNVLLAGDLGQGAPREIVLSPRPSGGQNSQGAILNRQPQEPDDEGPEQPEDQPPAVNQPQPVPGRPGFGPNGPIRTPQQIMEEMQQRQQQQLQQQQQQQLQQQQLQPQQPQQNPQR